MANDRKFYVYVLRCKGGQFYTGHTNNLDRRLAEHKKAKGSKHLARYPFEELIGSQEFNTRAEAMNHEKVMKKWKQSRKIKWACQAVAT